MVCTSSFSSFVYNHIAVRIRAWRFALFIFKTIYLSDYVKGFGFLLFFSYVAAVSRPWYE